MAAVCVIAVVPTPPRGRDPGRGRHPPCRCIALENAIRGRVVRLGIFSVKSAAVQVVAGVGVGVGVEATAGVPAEVVAEI
jgi:hypothetical protein